MPKVEIVEFCSPLDNPGSSDPSVNTELAFVGSSRETVLRFIEEHPNYSRSVRHWCWSVYAVNIDDPRSIPHDKAVIGRDGQVYGCLLDAWEACDEKPSDPSPTR